MVERSPDKTEADGPIPSTRTRMEEEKRLKSKWWAMSLEIFGQVSAWVAGPIIAALIAGKALDRHFDTVPWIFLGLTAIAFFISIAGIWRILAKYIKTIEKEKKENGGEH